MNSWRIESVVRMVEQRFADSLKLFWFLQISVGCGFVLSGDENHCAAKHVVVSALGPAVGSVQEVFRFQQPAVMKFLLPSIKKPQRELRLEVKLPGRDSNLRPID